MKYKVTTTRTYVTEMIVVADSENDACEWVMQNGDAIHNAELEQMNVVSEDSQITPITLSENEAEELLDLAGRIDNLLRDYRHVEDFIPSELHHAIANMVKITEDED